MKRTLRFLSDCIWWLHVKRCWYCRKYEDPYTIRDIIRGEK